MAFDVDPGSYAQSPDGTSAIQAVGGYRTSTHLKYSGSGVATSKAGDAKDSRVATESMLVHYTGFYEVAGVMIDPHIFIPYGSYNHARISGVNLNGATGWGDPGVAIVVAPIHTPDNSHVLGFGFGGFFPMGQYEKGKTFNMGENRWKGIFQIDTIQQIVDDWFFAGSVDVTAYSDNTNAGSTGRQVLSQELTYQVQPWIRYRVIPGINISAGYSQTYGGKQRLDGVENGAESNARQIRLDLLGSPIDGVFMGIQLGRDIATEGNYRESLRISGRITYLF